MHNKFYTFFLSSAGYLTVVVASVCLAFTCLFSEARKKRGPALLIDLLDTRAACDFAVGVKLPAIVFGLYMPGCVCVYVCCLFFLP